MNLQREQLKLYVNTIGDKLHNIDGYGKIEVVRDLMTQIQEKEIVIADGVEQLLDESVYTLQLSYYIDNVLTLEQCSRVDNIVNKFIKSPDYDKNSYTILYNYYTNEVVKVMMETQGEKLSNRDIYNKVYSNNLKALRELELPYYHNVLDKINYTTRQQLYTQLKQTTPYLRYSFSYVKRKVTQVNTYKQSLYDIQLNLGGVEYSYTPHLSSKSIWMKQVVNRVLSNLRHYYDTGNVEMTDMLSEDKLTMVLNYEVDRYKRQYDLLVQDDYKSLGLRDMLKRNKGRYKLSETDIDYIVVRLGEEEYQKQYREHMYQSNYSPINYYDNIGKFQEEVKQDLHGKVVMYKAMVYKYEQYLKGEKGLSRKRLSEVLRLDGEELVHDLHYKGDEGIYYRGYYLNHYGVYKGNSMLGEHSKGIDHVKLGKLPISDSDIQLIRLKVRGVR